jgi:YHS domain-containing protein
MEGLPMHRPILFLVSLLMSLCVQAQTFINVVGSDDKTAVSSFDTVAFFTQKKALVGSPEFSHSYLGAKWLFSSAENLRAFQTAPEKYLPEWGGQCAWCVSENCVSEKKLSGDFEFVDGKLYLFAYGNKSKTGAKDDFLYGRYSRAARIRDGEKYWPALKAKLEDGSLAQPNSKNFRKTQYDQ